MQRLLGSSANRRLCCPKGDQRKFSYTTAPVAATSDTKDCTRADGVSQLGGMRIEWMREGPSCECGQRLRHFLLSGELLLARRPKLHQGKRRKTRKSSMCRAIKSWCSNIAESRC